jgi:hypothetical protein
VHGRCAELWRWMLGRPEEEIVLVSHESLLFHMLNFGCALLERQRALSLGTDATVCRIASSSLFSSGPPRPPPSTRVRCRCPELPPDDIGGLSDGSDQAPPRPILARPKEIAGSDPIVGYGSSEAFELLVRREPLLLSAHT